ncbi:anaerobic glycerol-3-phosphate dehydrogenase subunit GlpC [Yersinia kristensenii]|uniref:anaerobic glycerol-3-phosphate dehydrogenase subunit GlpC n=1 Tax=Yersinia kristensenii TaxID=28152 RepID=UPI0005E0901C|nr:anaerobic glycerol-3-phosphate dehydrogenase subunit GlpC [Yersinia kristensenii]CFR21331.1 sn-glycerol-3-phosphate dehydrogenase subunit C [Yersinia kristensenii]
MTGLPLHESTQDEPLYQNKHLARDNSFESCIKCTVCTTYCPVAKVNPLYPGPKQAGPDGERLRLKDPALYDDALKYCTNCKRCEVACPSDVKIGDIIQRAKASYSSNKPKLRDAILSHTDLMGTLSTPFAPVINAVTGLKPVRVLLDKALKIDHRRELPKYSFGTFRRWYRKQAEKQQQYAEQVAFFHGCFVNYNHPQLGKDLVSVFNAMNIGVQLLKREKCCGVPLIANGFIEQAKKQARVNLESLTDAVIDRDIPVVATSSSCTFTLRDEYPHLLDVDTAPVRDRVELATRYLYRLLEKGRELPLKPLFSNGNCSAQNKPLRIAYHTPCHMEKMGWTAYTLALLQRIPGIELVVLDSQCCGIAGTYGFKSENYATSQGIGASLFQQIEDSGVDLVITDCETCKWQIEMSTSKKCEHPITLLARALA